jgi:hypothetical protein
LIQVATIKEQIIVNARAKLMDETEAATATTITREQIGVTLRFNLENATDRVFRIAKESEFTPLQYSPPRFVSASLTYHF